MSDAATILVEQLLGLPVEDRIAVMDRIWDSFDDATRERLSLADGGDAEDVNEDPAFRAELERRLQSVADGTAELIPWEQARAAMREELERRRAARTAGKSS